MEKNSSILEETRRQILTLAPSIGNDKAIKIYLAISLATINGMIKAQKASEKIGTAIVARLNKRIKSKGR